MTFELPTWSIFKLVVAPVEAEAVVLLPIVLFSPSCNTSKVKLAPIELHKCHSQIME